MPNLGDYLKSINTSTDNLMDEDSLAEREYVPFVINRTLSYFVDTILYANEMNTRPGSDNRLQYDYLLNSIRQRSRFSRWSKPEKEVEALKAIKTAYGYSSQKAKEVMDLFTDDQIESLVQRLKTGGVTNAGHKSGKENS